MDHDPWYEVAYQREKAVDDPPRSLTAFKRGILTDESYFTDLFDATSRKGEPGIPLSYYTKTCAWASDYPFTYRRAMVFLNPWHLDTEPSLSEYIQREFGCSRDTFVKLVADRWLVVMLDRSDRYDPTIQREIKALFEDINDTPTDRTETVRPRYVNLVDLALGAKVAEEGAADDKEFGPLVRNEEPPYRNEYVDIENTIEAWMRTRDQPWRELDTDEQKLYGVKHPNLRRYVTERAAKLQLAANALGNELSEKGDADPGSLVESMVNRIGEVDRKELSRQVYSDWNHVGTPMYYCDFSGTADVGPEPQASYLSQFFDRTSEIVNNVRSDVEEVRVKIGQKDGMNNNIRIPDFEEIKTSVVFGVSPSESSEAGLSSLRDRIDQHDEYYRRFDSEIVTGGVDLEAGSRADIRYDANKSVDNAFRTGKEGKSKAARLVKVAGAATGASSISLAAGFLTPGVSEPLALSSVGLGLVGTVLSYQSQSEVDDRTHATIPRPNSADLDLGRLNRWEIPYGTRSGMTDGGSDDSLTYIKEVNRL